MLEQFHAGDDVVTHRFPRREVFRRYVLVIDFNTAFEQMELRYFQRFLR